MKIKKFESINVVPFIDIMLVLLVIVLTTATFIAQGIIPIELPTSKSAMKQDENKSITFTIKPNGNIFADKELIKPEEIEAYLTAYDKHTAININCDKEAKFDYFVLILDTLKQKHFENVGIITKKEN